MGKPATTCGQQTRPIAGRMAPSIFNSDGRLVLTAIVRKVFKEKPGEFDPRKYLGPARDELIKMMIRKNKEVLGSAQV